MTATVDVKTVGGKADRRNRETPVSKRSEHTYDVAIIGYGPTGVTAANLLGARGLDVLVIERDADLYARARAISTDEEVLRIWQRLGLAERLKRDMLTGRPIAFVDAVQRPFLDFAAPSRNQGHPPQAFIYQPALEQVLRDGVDRYPSVEVRLATECLRVRQVDDHVELLLASDGDDVLTRAQASWVIAADGGSSPTRGSLGIGFEGRTYEDRWVVIDTEVLAPWPEEDHLRFHCDPHRPAVDCPTPLGHHRWEFPVDDGEDEAHLLSEDGIWELLGGHGIAREQVKIMRAVVYSHHVRFASKWRRDRIFLAGDAAHVMPPWIGQGMAAGVRDVDNLCWKLAEVVRGTLPEAALDTYELERQPHVRSVTTRAVNVGRMICERRTSLARLRNVVGTAINRLGPAADALHDAMWIPDARYGDGLLAESEHAAQGRKPPQPRVWPSSDTDAEASQLLDDVIGDRWAVLHVGAPPAGTEAWATAGAHVMRFGPGGDWRDDGTLTAWMRQRKAVALVLRPDRFVYAAASSSGALPPPLSSGTSTAPSIRQGVRP